MTCTSPEKIIDALWAVPRGDDTRLYAVLDGARNTKIHPAVLNSGCEFECLYTGELEPDLAQAAPYLVKLEPDMPFTDMLIEKGWGDSWGIFLHSLVAFRDLRRHLRKFLMVYDPDLKPMYFRYYDPRVLRIFLPTCDKAQLTEFFGPVRSYLGEDEAPDNHVLLRFSNDAGTLRRETFPISPA